MVAPATPTLRPPLTNIDNGSVEGVPRLKVRQGTAQAQFERARAAGLLSAGRDGRLSSRSLGVSVAHSSVRAVSRLVAARMKAAIAQSVRKRTTWQSSDLGNTRA